MFASRVVWSYLKDGSFCLLMISSNESVVACKPSTVRFLSEYLLLGASNVLQLISFSFKHQSRFTSSGVYIPTPDGFGFGICSIAKPGAIASATEAATASIESVAELAAPARPL